MLRVILIFTLLLATASHAQIFKTTDENGNVVFTDTPPADSSEAEKVQIRELNTAPPPAQQTGQAGTTEAPSEQTAQFNIVITEPDNESTIPNGPGNFSVRGTLQPALQRGQQLQLYLNGEPWGEPQSRAAWELVNVFRGAQDLTISVLTSDGKALATSEPVRVYVHRPSVNFRNRN